MQLHSIPESATERLPILWGIVVLFRTGLLFTQQKRFTQGREGIESPLYAAETPAPNM